MKPNGIKANYLNVAIQAMEKLIALPTTDADEDRTIKALMQMLKMACSGYDGTFQKGMK